MNTSIEQQDVSSYDVPLTFGKHKGKTIAELVKEKEYVYLNFLAGNSWVKENNPLAAQLARRAIDVMFESI